jgi:hypothetical protein
MRPRTPGAAASARTGARICSASSSRMTPLSTKMHVRRSPIARWMSTAATLESTPPLSPQTRGRPPPARGSSPSPRRRTTHRPVTGAAADAVREVAQDVGAVVRVRDLGVKEQRVQPASSAAMAATGALGWWRSHETRAARPGRSRRGSPTRAGPTAPTRTAGLRLDVDRRQAELAVRRGRDLAAKRVGHQLHAVADPEHRQVRSRRRRCRSAAPPVPRRSSGRPRG